MDGIALINQIIVFFLDSLILGLGFWAFFKNKKGKVNQIIFSLSIIIFLWVTFGYLSPFAADIDQSIIRAKINFALSFAIIIPLYFLTVYFPSFKGRSVILDGIILSVSTVFCLVTLFTDTFVKGVEMTEFGVNAVIFGDMEFIFHIVLLLLAFFVMLGFFKKYAGLVYQEKSSTQHVLFGFSLFVVFGIIFHSLVSFMVQDFIFYRSFYYALGDYSAVFFLGFSAYAVAREDVKEKMVSFYRILMMSFAILPLTHIFLSTTLIEYVWNFVSFSLFIILGYLLMSGIIGESEQKAKLTITNKELEEMIRKKTEGLRDALTRAEEERNKNHALIFNLSDGLLFLDEDKVISIVNPRAEFFLGIMESDIKRKKISELGNLPNFSGLMKLFEGEMDSILRKEVKIREGLILEVTSVSIKQDNGRMGMLIILHDVTREKMTEKTKTEFVSITAHQLRMPLSTIKWAIDMILKGDFGPINQDQSDFLKKVFISNEKMIHLINDFLNMARIEEGRYLYNPDFGNMEKIVDSAIDSHRSAMEKKRMVFAFKKDQEGSFQDIFIDSEKIGIAVQNILDNAISYTGQGGKIDITLKQSDNEVFFSVKDNGIGISEGQRARVFTKFFRSPDAIRMDVEGSGLGLFIVKNIIDAHGGKIWFETELGKGTTFFFSFPVVEKF
ncbi:hypothetical protein BWK69_01210 [Candidatus Parcubacteria bacterium A4]|nr:MAG: hypothetical protein BWK69_01210 [Candidatus Parcubacteria bacterium A4]